MFQCKAGGSAGSVVAWDMRRQQELIPLAGAIPSMGRSALEFPIVAEGEIWEVKFDPALYERGLMTEVGKVPPVFVCSEDGILALLHGGQYPSPSPSPCSFVIS
jgi:nuclear pore complex protein Nup43